MNLSEKLNEGLIMKTIFDENLLFWFYLIKNIGKLNFYKLNLKFKKLNLQGEQI